MTDFLTNATIASPKKILEYEQQTLMEMMQIPALREQLRNLDFFNTIFLASRYYVTLEETDDLIALIDASETVIDDDSTSVANKSLDSSVDSAIQTFINSANGGPVGNDFWKNGLFPVPQAYVDFHLFFARRFNSEVKSPDAFPMVFYTDLPDGTRITVYPIEDSTLSPTIQISKRPFGANPPNFKMRYLLPEGRL